MNGPMNGPEFGHAGTINFALLWKQVYLRVDGKWTEYGRRESLFGSENDQPGRAEYDPLVFV